MIRGMTCRQVGCGATAVLSDGERAWLQLLPDPADTVPVWGWCELEPGHDGLHYLLGQQSAEQLWWLCWHDREEKRELRHVLPCPAEDQPDELGDTTPCTLFLDHPGRHSFNFDVGDLPEHERPPLIIPSSESEAEGLTGQQRDNREQLRAEGLTVWTLSYLAQLMIQEEIMGERSTQHPGGTTHIPLPQLTRYPATTPGLAAAVARGYLTVHPIPPYEPLYGGTRADTVIVGLTPAGRAVCRRIDPDRFARP